MNYDDFYQNLFAPIEANFGELDSETLTSFIGFSAGGPVSLSQIASKQVYVTCELSQYPQQKISAEGLKYEFLSAGSFDEAWCRIVFTALGALSQSTQLGDQHTVDLSGLIDELPNTVQLSLFSKSTIDGNDYGIYKISAT